MAQALFGSLFGGSQPAPATPAGDSDFADFAEAAEPSPASLSTISTQPSFTGLGAQSTGSAVPWTKWYNVHERHSLSEFKQEGVILVILLGIIAIHLLGTSANRKKAKSWITATAIVLQKEFAVVGFGGRSGSATADAESEGLAKAIVSGSLELPVELIKERSLCEFSTYASGRQNVAFLDFNLALHKRYSPLSMIAEHGMSLFFSSPAPVERMEAILIPFDGREASIVPRQVPGAQEVRKDKSSYDPFVWAIVNKDTMKQLRDDRYDVSLTSTKDSAKLPNLFTVMAESAEITELLLTPELIKAIETAGDLLEHLIITDQPSDAPLKLDDTVPRKRLVLSLKVPSSGDYSSVLPILEYFIRLADILSQSAHFRPEVMRKVKVTRDNAMKQLQKVDEESKAEERALEREKFKKLKRDNELKALDAKAQKRYLEKEKEKEQRKSQKKMSQKG
ncbi:putative UPF0674 endoplasmic reticulum membrane protein [Calycina marina]|uniref:UPF0674 endoplasmic reticulum membrane protein n=1 Tax=Calycina marina TaxID=1763456 RepID=A0A9P7Z2U4_9HELO|nr:putative UPF0674 endoplasmic reticulum membrane protein [Calycina marina]